MNCYVCTKQTSEELVFFGTQNHNGGHESCLKAMQAGRKIATCHKCPQKADFINTRIIATNADLAWFEEIIEPCCWLHQTQWWEDLQTSEKFARRAGHRPGNKLQGFSSVPVDVVLMTVIRSKEMEMIPS